MTEKPCPVYIIIDRRTEKRADPYEEGPNTYRIYCEQKGEHGSHVGDRHEHEYKRLLAESK